MSDLFGDAKQQPKPQATTAAAVQKKAAPIAPPPPPAPVVASAPTLQTQRVEVLNGSKRTETSFTKAEENR
jgi:hypothetical protein